MDLLARREHSRHQLASKLVRKGLDAHEVTAALDDLAREGLQSDARFTESFIAARAERGQGPVRIRGDLVNAGVADEVIEHALAGCGVDWRARARAVLSKKFGGEPPQSYAEKTKRMRFLNQRGFSMDEIRAALGETHDD